MLFVKKSIKGCNGPPALFRPLNGVFYLESNVVKCSAGETAPPVLFTFPSLADILILLTRRIEKCWGETRALRWWTRKRKVGYPVPLGLITISRVWWDPIPSLSKMWVSLKKRTKIWFFRFCLNCRLYYWQTTFHLLRWMRAQKTVPRDKMRLKSQ